MSGKPTGRRGNENPELSLSGKAIRPVSKPTITTKNLKLKIEKIKRQIDTSKKNLKKERATTEEKQKYQEQMNNLLDELRRLQEDPEISSIDKESLRQEIAALRGEIELPNLHQPYLHPEQEKARAAAAQVLTDWESVTPGVSLNDLSPEARNRLEACTMEPWSPLQVVLLDMMAAPSKEDSKVLTARVNFARALYMSMVPLFCGQGIPTPEAVQSNTNNVHNLLECIAIVACNECQKNYNPLFVFAEAAFQNPLQFLKDAAGGGFAVGVLAEMAGQTVVRAVSQLPGAAFTAATYVAQNPLASFTTYKATEPYIRGLLQQVFGERFGNQQQPDPQIQRLFDELSEFYLREGVTDIIGFPPADVDSVRNKLSQMLYNIGYRGVASMQNTGGIIQSAIRLPGELCSSAMSAASAIKSWWCGQGMRLLDRYKFIPEGTEGGLFESILACLDHKGLLEDPDINNFVIAFLKHSKPTTVFHQSVAIHMAVDDAQDPFLGSHQMSQGMDVEASQKNPNPDELEYVGPDEGSGELMDERVGSAKPYTESSHGDELGQFRSKQNLSQLQSSRDAVAARQLEDEEAARLAADQPNAFPLPNAQGGFAQGGNPGSFFSSGPDARSSPAFAQGGNLGGNLGGGRSRSRKHSVSKRTRRKGVAKKQKSKKNKRQSRRKVRRASSRKLRK
jgi:hypothetical protein